MVSDEQIDSIAAHMIAHWYSMNKIPVYEKLILVKCTENIDNYYSPIVLDKDDNKIPLWISPSERFSVGYIIEEENKKFFHPFDYMYNQKYNHYISFSKKMFEKWIYLDEIANL